MKHKKNYKKTCLQCGVDFMGYKTALYCCASHKVIHWQQQQAINPYRVLEELLEIELSGTYYDAAKLVQVCMRCIRRFKDEKRTIIIDVKEKKEEIMSLEQKLAAIEDLKKKGPGLKSSPE